jgi:hypothetical protein
MGVSLQWMHCCNGYIAVMDASLQSFTETRRRRERCIRSTHPLACLTRVWCDEETRERTSRTVSMTGYLKASMMVECVIRPATRLSMRATGASSARARRSSCTSRNVDATREG